MNTPIKIIPIVISKSGIILTNARTVEIFPICVAINKQIPYGGVTIPHDKTIHVIIQRCTGSKLAKSPNSVIIVMKIIIASNRLINVQIIYKNKINNKNITVEEVVIPIIKLATNSGACKYPISQPIIPAQATANIGNEYCTIVSFNNFGRSLTFNVL